MSNFHKSTKNPRTGKMETATWIDLGSYYLITFPDGTSYEEKDLQEKEIDTLFKGFKKDTGQHPLEGFF